MSYITRRALSTLIPPKGLGAAQDAARMARVVSFYEKLPRGPAPEIKAKGLLGRYQAKYFGKNDSATPIIHVLAFLVAIGYAQNYYFHLPTSENFAAPSITPDNELNTTETKSQDVTSEQVPTLNGTTTDKDGSIPNSDLLESINNSAEVSVSGGSDTEATKAEASKNGDDKGGHLRSTSTVKRPTSFKAVSVNKTFLASKASTAAAPSKLGEKGPAASTSTPATLSASSSAQKPRLVAKSGSGLRDSTPRAANAANGGKPGGAPDASAVWNKNRRKAAPPPEPKRFTDEELKQRYGIHLATRLQSDDPGKQANWADIDDDDDDWAPESIEWTDGTKITLPQADEAHAPPPEPAAPVPTPITKEVKKVEPAPKPSVSPAPQPTASPVPKPSVFGSGRAGLVLKGASEKPTLVAKPPGPPTPVKSPWATLPPVEKVAPIAVDVPQAPSQQSQQSRFSQRDPHSFSGMPPPPAKEIAADDFSRTWRDGNAHAGRELYNSQSGRYEPVNENRRGTSRHDGQSRGPAVLQRPAQHDVPAEPSAAFQTHRSNGPENTYGRRRTSSNVSGGSGNFARRMSRGHDMPPPHDMLGARRGSLAAVSDEPSSPGNFSPSGQQLQNQRGYPGQPWQSRASPIISHPSPQSVHGQLTPGSGDMHMHAHGPPQMGPLSKEDPLEEQKNIMKRTRELAIKRRQEAEAKEEAERKERIRIKLEAMGPPPEKKKNKEEPLKDEKSNSTNDSTRDAEQSVTSNAEANGEGHAHGPASVNEKFNRHVEGNASSHDSRPNGNYQPITSSSAAPAQQNLGDNRNSQSWQKNNSGTDRFTTWSAAPPPAQNSSRIWGPPTNEKTIGNGTFNPELSRLPDMPHSTRPGPIGPPGAMRGNAPYQPNRGRDQYGSRPPPIGPPSTRPPKTQEDEQRSARAREIWGNVPAQIAQEDAILRQQQQEEMDRKRELEAAGIVEEPHQPVFKETWKQVGTNLDGTRGKTKAVVTTIHDAKSAGHTNASALVENNPPSHVQNDELTRPQFNTSWRPSNDTNSSPPVRDSRFFPANRDIRLEGEQMNGALYEQRSSSPSPPPPTMAGHPAYDGDVSRPHVALPPPLPVVRLPPPTVVAPIAPPRPQSFAAAVATPAVPALHKIPGLSGRQELAARGSADIRRSDPAGTKQGEWRDKINNLFGKKSPPRTHALAVDSASRHALDHSEESQTSATVSLPGSINGNIPSEEPSIFTKPAAEECFEEQEMGSLPAVKVPHIIPQNLWHPAAPPKNVPKKFVLADPISVEAFTFPHETRDNNDLIIIMLPGQETSKSVLLLASRTKSNPRRGGRGGSRQNSSAHPRGGRARDASSNFASSARDNSSPSPNAPSRGRGGRGFGGSWGRHVATPVHT
ncbi:hypothetical protein CJF32_00006199 [Rutstroemia sp. NJR-2017a WRK4]|nr:hypothetical protein CJF32_00006199 [Rutstroemia sp. NJR-2017a WRK4]